MFYRYEMSLSIRFLFAWSIEIEKRYFNYNLKVAFMVLHFELSNNYIGDL